MVGYVSVGFLLGALFVGLIWLTIYLFEDTHNWDYLPGEPFKFCKVCKKEVWDDDGTEPLILNRCVGKPLPIAQRHPKYTYDRREDF